MRGVEQLAGTGRAWQAMRSVRSLCGGRARIGAPVVNLRNSCLSLSCCRPRDVSDEAFKFPMFRSVQVRASRSAADTRSSRARLSWVRRTGPSAVAETYTLEGMGTGLTRLLSTGRTRESLFLSRSGSPAFILSRLAVFSSLSSPSRLVLLPTIALTSHLARLLLCSRLVTRLRVLGLSSMARLRSLERSGSLGLATDRSLSAASTFSSSAGSQPIALAVFLAHYSRLGAC
jgi:hypothetical protein